jgi:hypothetical protein
MVWNEFAEAMRVLKLAVDRDVLEHLQQIEKDPDSTFVDSVMELVEAGVNKDLIKNEYLLSKMAKEEYEMPQSDSDVESESGEEDRKSDKSDNESEYDDDDGDDNEEDDNDDDNEDDDESEKLACNHCGKETGHIVYLMKCPRYSWKDFYLGKNAQCMICDEQSPLLFSHVIGFCELRPIQTGRDLATRREFSVFNDI